jgi:hypothetical protein
MPKTGTKELSDAEDFLGRAMSLHDLITRLGDTSSSSPLVTIEHRVREDMSKYGRRAQGNAGDGTSAGGQGTRLTNEQMQDAAWMQSGATQADMIIRQFSFALSRAPITTDAQKVSTDITGDRGGLHLDQVIGDLQALLHDIEVATAQINQLITLRESDGSALTPKSAAGALLVYVGPLMNELNDARNRVNALLDPSVLSQLNTELTLFSQKHDLVGKDGNGGTCLGAP